MSIQYAYFISGHCFVYEPGSTVEPQPLNINTVVRFDLPITDDPGLDRLTQIVEEQVQAECEDQNPPLSLAAAPTIRFVNLLHRVKVDANGQLVEVLS